VTYAWGYWLIGLLTTLIAGAVLNVVAGLIAIGMKPAIVSFFVGIVPGVIAIAIGLLKRRHPFGQGVLLAGCIIALIGGICGASLSGARFAG